MKQTSKPEFDPFQHMQNIPESTGDEGKPTTGTYVYTSPDFNGTFPVFFHAPKTDKLCELEGVKVETGPNGGAVVSKRPYQYFEQTIDEVTGRLKETPIDKKQVRAVLRYEDGSEDPFFNLKQTKVFLIVEGRPITEATLDPKDVTKSYGTTIPRSDVEKYSVERMQEEWEPVHAGLKALSQHLERTKQAMLYPYSFGGGRKLYTCISYPERVEAKLFLMKRFSSGQLIFSHPLEAPAEGSQQTSVVSMPVVRIRNKAAKQASL